VNNETPAPSDPPMPPGDAGAKPGAGRNRRTMRRTLLAGLGVAGLTAGATAYWRLLSDGIAGGVEVHARARELPPLRFTDGNGAATRLAAFRDRVVLLNVWATWCPPCREEISSLDRLQAALGRTLKSSRCPLTRAAWWFRHSFAKLASSTCIRIWIPSTTQRP
jgi:redoxin